MITLIKNNHIKNDDNQVMQSLITNIIQIIKKTLIIQIPKIQIQIIVKLITNFIIQMLLTNHNNNYIKHGNQNHNNNHNDNHNNNNIIKIL